MELFDFLGESIENNNFEDIREIGFSSLCLKHGDYGALEIIKNLKYEGVKFGITDLDFSSKFLLPLVLSSSPIYVGIINLNSNHICGSYLEPSKGFSSYGLEVLKMLENFNICIDLKNLSSLSRYDAILNTNKNIICSNCFLSTTSAKNRLSTYEEELLVKRETLLLLNAKNEEQLIPSIIEFARRYGIKNLAIDTRNISKTKIKNLTAMLLQAGFPLAYVNRLLYKNANNFFSLSLVG